jgi:hypothetical protein
MKRPVAAVLFLGAAVVVWQPPIMAAGQMRVGPVCAFSVLFPSRAPSRRTDQPARLRLVSQPDSPVAVTEVLFPFFMFPLRPPSLPAEMPYSLHVMNVSDRLVRSVQLYMQMRSPAGMVAGGPAITRALGPGERVMVRSDAAQLRRLLAATSDDVMILVAVESVEFADCIYRPSQAPQVFDKPVR